jgi:hypothetical protein
MPDAMSALVIPTAEKIELYFPKDAIIGVDLQGKTSHWSAS